VKLKAVVRKLLNKIRERDPKPDSERLRVALSRSGEPDRVPFMELFADGEVKAAVLSKPLNFFSRKLKSYKEWEDRMFALIEFHEMLGYDYVRADTCDYDVIMKKAKESQTLFSVGKVGSRAYRCRTAGGDRAWANEDTGIIGDWKDFNDYPWENPEDIVAEGNSGLEWVCDHVPSGMGVITGNGSVLEPVMWMMGIKNFYVSLYKQPDLVDAMFKKAREINIARFKLAAGTSRKIVAFWGSDDWGYKNGLMISPAMMRRWVFPVHKKMAEMAHSKGSFYVLHSCGDLSAIMDDIIDDVKVDAKHSFEDTYLPVSVAKKLYGQRMGLIGGVDMDVLGRSSPDEIRSYVTRVLETCKPGGGYCLGTGNSVANYLPLENYLTMLLTGLEEGWYK
jgi:uroporphyrinogen decarboxylase